MDEFTAYLCIVTSMRVMEGGSKGMSLSRLMKMPYALLENGVISALINSAAGAMKSSLEVSDD